MIPRNLQKPIIAIFSFALVLFPQHAFAQYNAGKLGEAAGGFLNSVDMVIQLKSSKCGYVIRKEYSFKQSLIEVKSYLKEKDRKELDRFLKQNYTKMQNDNKYFIDDSLRAGERDGLDKKTLCGIISSQTALVYKYAQQKWEYAKKYYTE